MYGFRRWFRNQKIAKSITILLFLGVLFAVGFGIYSFFRWEFGLIAHDAYLRVALPLFFYEGLFLVVFLLIFVSSFITAMFALFRGGMGNVLPMASPRYPIVFWQAYRTTLFSGIWPLAVITIPAFLGSAAVFPVSFWGGALFLISAVCLAGLAASLAIIFFFIAACGLYIVAHYTSRRIFSFGKAVGVGVVAIALGLWLIARRVGLGDVTAIFAPVSSAWSTSRIDILFERFGAFPSHLATLTLFGAQQGAFGVAALTTATLVLMFALGALGVRIAAWGFLPLWQIFQEGRYEAKAVSTATAIRRHGKEGPISFPRFFRSPLGALFEKEGIVMFRGMKSALWFFFLFVLWMVQVALEFFIRGNLVKYGTSIGSALAIVESLQLATAIYFVSAFILRFVFPAFSGEGRTAWILGTAPLRMQNVFWAKFLFYASIFLALGLVFCGLNFFIIQTAVAQGLAFGAFTLLIIVFLVAFGLGLGAIFPNFESDDPEVLSTSLPGLGFIFGSLFYGGAGSYLFYRFLAGTAPGAGMALAGFDALTVLLTIIIFALSLRALGTFEFVKDY